MEPSDLEEVHIIEASWSPSPWSHQSFLQELRNPFSHCFILRLEQGLGPRLIGYLCFRNIGEESELLNLGIHPQYRRRGFGRQLMHFYIDFCKRDKIRAFYLETPCKNQPAIRLYQSFAYRTIGTRPKFYWGEEDALRMKRASPEERRP